MSEGKDSGDDDHDDAEGLRSANDHFFQGFFGITDASRGFLEPSIVQELSACLDWRDGAMDLVRGVFVDPRLRFKAADLLWKVRTLDGQDAFVCISFDHQTRPDRWMALRYLVIQGLVAMRSLDDDEGKPKSKLPVIYCVLLYQGKEPWNVPTQFQDLVNLDAFPESSREVIRGFVPRFRYQVISLQKSSNEALPEHRLTRLGLTLMRAAILHDLADWVRENRDEFVLLLRRDDKDTIFYLLFNYAVQKTRNEYELDQLNEAIESLDEPTRNQAMNGAQILEARGEARGEIKGRVRSRIDDVKRLLKRDFDPDAIADILEVPLELVMPLSKGEDPDLTRWMQWVSASRQSGVDDLPE